MDIVTKYENERLQAQFSGLDQIPQLYQALIQHTRSYLDTVLRLARIPGGFPQSASLIVDFANNILGAQSSCFHIMLNCQRSHIYWLLDEAMLEILLDEWEGIEDGANAWPKAILPIITTLNEGIIRPPDWIQRDTVLFTKYNLMTWHSAVGAGGTMELGLFRKTFAFLEDSLVVYDLRQKVNGCLDGRLPAEIVEDIIEDVSIFEGVPVRLREKYSPKGKKKAT